MDFAPDETARDVTARARAFLDEQVLPAEPVLDAQLAATPDDWTVRPIVRELQAEARAAGLWNLFLPGDRGAGLTNLQYAPVAEVTGWSPRLAPAAFNCAAPATGNMEVLTDFGTPEQKDRWLARILSSEDIWCQGFSEPDAGSDLAAIRTTAVLDGDHYVIDGRKWWSTGAMNPEATILIVMGKTDPDAPRHRQQSMILVPRDTPGVRIVRPLTVFGYDDRDHGGHAEVAFENVRVPASNLIAAEGDGFAIAQAGLGPGRIHHCMRAIGTGERALALMTARANERHAFGSSLSAQGVVREWIAESRIDLEALRLLVLKTAWLMDTVGNREAMTEIQAIKIAVPRAVQRIVDRAIQLHGGAGVSADTPLAELYAGVRSLRIADGPDEVHLNGLGRAQLRDRPLPDR